MFKNKLTALNHPSPSGINIDGSLFNKYTRQLGANE